MSMNPEEIPDPAAPRTPAAGGRLRLPPPVDWDGSGLSGGQLLRRILINGAQLGVAAAILVGCGLFATFGGTGGTLLIGLILCPVVAVAAPIALFVVNLTLAATDFLNEYPLVMAMPPKAICVVLTFVVSLCLLVTFAGEFSK